MQYYTTSEVYHNKQTLPLLYMTRHTECHSWSHKQMAISHKYYKTRHCYNGRL